MKQRFLLEARKMMRAWQDMEVNWYAKFLEVADENARLRHALQAARVHIESTSCGSEPYRANTLWRIADALGENRPVKSDSEAT